MAGEFATYQLGVAPTDPLALAEALRASNGGVLAISPGVLPEATRSFLIALADLVSLPPSPAHAEGEREGVVDHAAG